MPARRLKSLLAAALCTLPLATATTPARAGSPLPTLEDPNLTVQRLNVGRLSEPTGLAFLPRSGGDAFVLEKSTGRVKLIENNRVSKTVLRLNVESTSERGLLGIALHPRFTRNGLVYLYHTNANASGNPTDNRISAFRYDAAAKTLDFQRVIKKLPVSPGPNHDGGKIAFGPDRKLYAVIGDLNRNERTQNNEGSNTLNRTGAILRLNPKNGAAPSDNPFYNPNNTGRRAPLNEIYAYGVRNSFGLNFDPATGNLWDTENGPSDYDEINRIRPGMNSGWRDVMGPRNRTAGARLVSLGKNARYRDPAFSWEQVIGVTDIAFPMNNLGSTYRDSIFVGDNNTGSLYRFRLNADRSDLDLGTFANDRVADSSEDQNPIVFGENWGVITDIERGPGGLYLTAFDFNGNGALYKISLNPSARRAAPSFTAVPEPAALSLLPLTALTLLRRRKR